MKKTSKEDIIFGILGCLIISAIIGAVLNCIILPIGYIFVHDCGKWICSHNYPVTWESYFIVTSLVFVFVGILVTISSVSENNNTQPRYTRRRTHTYYSTGRETDYYDSDMEGAPGYYGGD